MSLTNRERTVLLLRQQGLTQSEVARNLKITQGAVSRFETNAYHKLRDAHLAIAFAKQHRISIPQ
jgi:transcriptional regulator